MGVPDPPRHRVMEHPTPQGKGPCETWWESLLHSLPPQHAAFPPVLHPPILGRHSDRLGGIGRGLLISLSGRDRKRSSCLSTCPWQDADDDPTRCLSNQFLKPPPHPQAFFPTASPTQCRSPTTSWCIPCKLRNQIIYFLFSSGIWMKTYFLPLQKTLNYLKIFHLPKDFPM